MDHTISLTKSEKPMETRNYGLDLLKALAMLLVVTLHVVGHGGLQEAAATLSAHYVAVWSFLSVAFAAVDMFVIITGYLYADKEIHAKTIINLWFQVFFYSMLIPLVMKLFGYDIGIKSILAGFFPILSRSYWFFNAYFALFCFIPVLNTISENELLLRRTLFISLILFSILPIFGLGADLFKTHMGSSFIWFTVLYLSGAYIKKYNVPQFIEKHCFQLFFLSSFLLLLSRLFFFIFTSRFMEKTQAGLFFSFSSPFVYFAAVCLVVGFKNLSVQSFGLKKTAMFLSSLSFDVYLIHDNPVFREQIISGAFCSYYDKGVIMMTVYIIATVLVIYFAGEFIGFLRAKLFALLHIKKLANKIGQALEARINTLVEMKRAS